MTATESIAEPPTARAATSGPVSIYEVHLDSWMRVPETGNRPLTDAEIAPKLAAYARQCHFTHVEFLQSATRRDVAKVAQVLREQGIGVMIEKPEAGGLPPSWDTAWARQTLDYLGYDPLYRRFHHDQIAFPRLGDGSGAYTLPLSHDLVVSENRSLISRMPGDDWQKFANMRLLFAYLFALPGRKLTFMGAEFGQWNPWNPGASLDWHLVDNDSPHARLQRWVGDLNRFYREERALQQTNRGFEAIDVTDADMSALAFLRQDGDGAVILAVFNFTPAPRRNYRVGVPLAGVWHEALNSDAVEYGGSGQGNLGGVEAAPFGWHDKSRSLSLTLPPLAALFFKAKP